MTRVADIDTFTEHGFMRVEEAFPPADAQTMCDLMWGVFEREFGILKEDPSTWTKPFRKGPLNHIGHTAVFWNIFTDRLVSVIDDLLGAGLWNLPESLGDFLVTFPNASTWILPHDGWHSDEGFVPGLMSFVFLNDVGPESGGTLVVRGSHRLPRKDFGPAESDGQGRKWKHRWEYEHECAWLRALRGEGDPTTRYRQFLQNATEEEEGVSLQVVELTGRAGDAFLCHPWLIHAIAPNASRNPRFMRTPRIRGTGA